MLQQAAELAYRAVIVSLWGTELRSHSIRELQRYVMLCAPRLNNCFPAVTHEDRMLLQKMEEAYVASRYRENFDIEPEMFEILFKRTEDLMEQAARLLNERFPDESQNRS